MDIFNRFTSKLTSLVTKHRKYIFPLVLAILIGALVYYLWLAARQPGAGSGFGELPQAVSPPSSTEWSSRLPDAPSIYNMAGSVSSDVEVDRLPVYKVSAGLSDEIVASLAEQLGFDSEPEVMSTPYGVRYLWRNASSSRLEIFPELGSILYKRGDLENTVLGAISDDKDQLKSLSLSRLEQLGLIKEPSSYELIRTSYLGGVGHLEEVSGPESALVTEVCLRYKLIEDRETYFSPYDSCPISVWLSGREGELGRLLWRVPYYRLEEQSIYKIKKLDQAWRELTAGQGQIAYLGVQDPGAVSEVWGESYLLSPDDFTSVSVEQAYLAYISSPTSPEYLIPIWVFRGKARIRQKEDTFYIVLYLQAV